MLLSSSEQLEELAIDFAKNLNGGEIVALYGGLGAGKTSFVRAACKALGVQRVTSPSYGLINIYTDGKFKIAHLDLYRLSSLEEFLMIGGDEVIKNHLSFIEWPELIKDELTHCINITIEIAGDNGRKVTIDEHFSH
ncbi:MAG: tRNA (adenosine(37)-N6)-threonylcarbamoyltransferase complex ATPase subunit type 1 TsaE [Spirochaetaceae bacterium]|nr:tRNA (adenosine(37)-N6)-threonylcarbamoyltransferase complex ATPase subunit type 1 TsaE [Spirochaetaceae bacterium]